MKKTKDQHLIIAAMIICVVAGILCEVSCISEIFFALGALSGAFFGTWVERHISPVFRRLKAAYRQILNDEQEDLVETSDTVGENPTCCSQTASSPTEEPISNERKSRFSQAPRMSVPDPTPEISPEDTADTDSFTPEIVEEKAVEPVKPWVEDVELPKVEVSPSDFIPDDPEIPDTVNVSGCLDKGVLEEDSTFDASSVTFDVAECLIPGEQDSGVEMQTEPTIIRKSEKVYTSLDDMLKDVC